MTDARTDIPPSGPAHHRGPIVGLGEVLWDLLPTAAVCGGAPANFASQIAGLGGRAVMVTAVGTDDLGNLAVATLLRHGVDCQHAQRDAAHPTGTVTVSLSATGDASYTFAPDTAWDHIAWNEALANLAAATAAVCFAGCLPRGGLAGAGAAATRLRPNVGLAMPISGRWSVRRR